MNFDLRPKRRDSVASGITQVVLLFTIALALTWLVGCNHGGSKTRLAPLDAAPCQSMLEQIDYPDLRSDDCDDEANVYSAEPITIGNYRDQIPLDLTLDECVEMTLANSKVLQKLGGVIINTPAVAATLFDPAIVRNQPGRCGSCLDRVRCAIQQLLFLQSE